MHNEAASQASLIRVVFCLSDVSFFLSRPMGRGGAGCGTSVIDFIYIRRRVHGPGDGCMGRVGSDQEVIKHHRLGRVILTRPSS